MSISSKLLPEFDEETAMTRKFLELIPDDKLNWKPHEKSMEMGRLGYHLAEFPEWARDTLKQDTLKLTEADGAAMMQGWKGKTRAEILARFDAALPEARSLLLDASDDAMNCHWKMEWAGQVIIDSPKMDVMRKWVLNHMIHHRAQLALYLRLNDIPIPGAYGPSADEATS